MTTPNELYVANPLTLDGTERLVGQQAGGTSGGMLTKAIADLFNGTKGADIASAGTTNIGAATGMFVHVTGTTTITAFDNVAAGILRIVVFTGILTLTYDATALILPTAANITTAAGDCAIFVSEGSGHWRCVSYDRASGQALAAFSTGTKEVWEYALSDETTAVTTGTKLTTRARRAFTLTDVRLSCTDASSSGNPTVDIKKNGTSIFSTKISIDSGEKTSVTAATPYVLTGAITFADDDEIAFSIDTAGTGCDGVKVALIGTV
jgi:hypothetical protein